MKQLYNFSFFTSLICVVLLTFAFVSATAFAATRTWDGGGGDNNWNTVANWDGDLTVPVAGDALVFSGLLKLATNNNITAGTSFLSITISATGFTIGGAALYLMGATAFLSNTTGSSTISLNINFWSWAPSITTSVGTMLTVSGTINNNSSAYPLTVSSAGTTNLSGIISGVGGLIKAGAGTLTLSGANTYTGATTINAGVLSVATIGNGGVAGNLGAATNAAANLVLGGGTLQYTGITASTDRAFTLTATTTSSIDVTTNILTISGAAAATTGSLTKIGSGTLTLSGGQHLHGSDND